MGKPVKETNMTKKILSGTLLCVMILGFLLASCATTAGTYSNKLMRVEVGMTKAQVTSIMGNPTDRTVSNNTETWFYWEEWSGSSARIVFTDGLVSGMSSDNR
jgi:outer membrane protein assembly factor BamE (lipoprotein component of BamABCDE complex)